MYITNEMEHLDMEINFTYEIFVSHMELEQFTHEKLFSLVKLYAKFL